MGAGRKSIDSSAEVRALGASADAVGRAGEVMTDTSTADSGRLTTATGEQVHAHHYLILFILRFIRSSRL